MFFYVCLRQEHEKQIAELKKMDLERQDLQAEKENVKVSLDYFQSKYQATQKDLKVQREQSEEYARGLGRKKAIGVKRGLHYSYDVFKLIVESLKSSCQLSRWRTRRSGNLKT